MMDKFPPDPDEVRRAMWAFIIAVISTLLWMGIILLIMHFTGRL